MKTRKIDLLASGRGGEGGVHRRRFLLLASAAALAFAEYGCGDLETVPAGNGGSYSGNAQVCSKGNTIDPAIAYRQFRGRDPGIGALMRKRGFPVPAEPAAAPKTP